MQTILASTGERWCWCCGDISDRHIETYIHPFTDSERNIETWCCMNCGKETETTIF